MHRVTSRRNFWRGERPILIPRNEKRVARGTDVRLPSRGRFHLNGIFSQWSFLFHGGDSGERGFHFPSSFESSLFPSGFCVVQESPPSGITHEGIPLQMGNAWTRYALDGGPCFHAPVTYASRYGCLWRAESNLTHPSCRWFRLETRFSFSTGATVVSSSLSLSFSLIGPE